MMHKKQHVDIVKYRILPDKNDDFSENMRLQRDVIGEVNPNYMKYLSLLSQSDSHAKKIHGLSDLYGVKDEARISIRDKTGVMLTKQGGCIELIAYEIPESLSLGRSA